jgi:hypothetical protein
LKYEPEQIGKRKQKERERERERERETERDPVERKKISELLLVFLKGGIKVSTQF